MHSTLHAFQAGIQVGLAMWDLVPLTPGHGPDPCLACSISWPARAEGIVERNGRLSREAAGVFEIAPSSASAIRGLVADLDELY